ncbi:hypothetical protein PR048_029874, partial [Dryococelus australis]
MDRAPPGSVYACNTTGWMRFKPTNDDSVLLILEGHIMHTKNLEVIEKARDNSVTILCLPAHCTHKMQSLDYNNMGLQKWLNTHPGRTVTIFQVVKLFGEAYLKAATPLNDIKGFQTCGIYQTDPDIFQDADFLAAETTDQALISESQAGTSNASGSKRPLANTIPLHHSQPSDNTATASVSACPPSPCTSKYSSISFVVSPLNIHPLPKRAKIQHKRGTSAILTSSPYKNELAANVTARDRLKVAADSRSKRQGKRKQLSQSVTVQGKKMTKEKSGGDSDPECLYCNKMFSDSAPGECWIKCVKDLRLSHDTCAGLDDME